MRKPALAALGLVAALALPASAAGSTGPFVGQVRQGETDSFTYDNNPTGNPCVQMAVLYGVTVRYAPTADTLTLHAGASTATGSGGTVATSVWGSTCTRFAVSVTGTSVADTATYVVTVTRQLLPPLT